VDELVCKIDGVVFSNRGTGFFILKAKDGSGSKVSIKGTFPGLNLNIGVKAKFCGNYEIHPTYGKQLIAQSCELLPEKGRNGTITYLINNVPSIGPITAAKLYSVFGDELLNVLENESDKILELDFLTRAQSNAILTEWKKSSELRTVAIFLTDLGLNAAQVRSVYSKFGIDTTQRVKDNPYILYECSNIGFMTADSAARTLGIGVDDIRRVRAMILYIMSELSLSEGHMYVTSKQINDYVKKIFNRTSLDSFSHGEYIAESHYYEALTDLIKQGDVVSKQNRLYLAPHWVYESMSAEYLSGMITKTPRVFGNFQKFLSDFEKNRNLTLSDEQKEAFFALEHSQVCVVSGFPGTGKTLLTSAFVHLFEEARLHYVLMSPTGIAAKRLSQVTGKPAFTIHRALGYGRDGTWEFSASNRFYSDAIIVDEMSMVDSSTFYHLISALDPSTILVLIGDVAQLPSVGAGYVLNNLMNCEDVPCVSLTKIFRQEKQSDIVTVAHSILAGEPVDTTFKPESEFLFLPFEQDKILGEVCKITSRMKEKSTNFQVIAPTYNGDLGVDNLNKELRTVLNSRFAKSKANKLKLRLGENSSKEIYEGDRVMVVRNDYDRMIFNGDVGKVERISLRDDEVQVRIFEWFNQDIINPTYEDKIFKFTVEEAMHVLRVAFACTTHKVQGQEFDYVIMPMTMKYGIMLYRNLIYTALTRAKKKAFIFGDPSAFQFAIGNNRETIRNSALSELIHSHIESQDESMNKCSSM